MSRLYMVLYVVSLLISNNITIRKYAILRVQIVKTIFLYSRLRIRLQFSTPSTVGSLIERQSSLNQHKQCARHRQSYHHRIPTPPVEGLSPLSPAKAAHIYSAVRLPKTRLSFPKKASKLYLHRGVSCRWYDIGG